MVAERPLHPQRRRRIDVALDHDIGVRRHLDIDGYPLDKRDAFLAQEPGKQNLIDLVRQGRRGRVNHGRVAAQADRQLQSAGRFFLPLIMTRAHFVQVPMHTGRARIKDLHSIQADVSRAFNGIFGKYHGQGDEGTGVTGPASEHR